MANAYYYAPRYRPPGYATLPEGYAIVATGKYYDLPLTMFDRPAASNMPFGVVVYRRELSADEVERYELDRVELVTGWPTPVPTATKWKKLLAREMDN